MAIQNYRDLLAWQKSMDVVEEVYRLTQAFPSRETYGLASQMRRAAVSIPSNIAEGQGRGASQAFVNHLRIAKGSLQELETQIQIGQRLGLISDDDVPVLLEKSCEVARLIAGLVRSLKAC